MKAKVSIIVPIYNVEKYLEECLETLVKQTYKNIEIILVDDGSPDKSPEICDGWAKKDKRIKVVHKKNGGLSDARNKGISIATGEYICFVDPDDYVATNYVEILYNTMIKDKTNISQCGVSYVDKNGKQIKNIGYNKNKEQSGKEMIIDYFSDHRIENVVVWNKLYKTDYFKKLKFPVGKIHEDEFITYKLFFFEEKVSIVKENLYYYRQTNNSIIRSKYNLRKLDLLDALKEKIDFFEKNNASDEIIILSVSQYLYSIRDAYYNLKKYFPSEKDKIKSLFDEYKTIMNKYKGYKIINKPKNKFFIISPLVFGVFKKIKNIL